MSPTLNFLNVAGAVHSSLLVVGDPVDCAATIPDVAVPLPEPVLALDAVPKSETSVQDVPSHDSVIAT